MDEQLTLILVKPDGVRRGLCGRIMQRFEERGMRLRGCKLVQVDEELARAHYHEHVERDFFPSLLAFITSTPVLAMAWSGRNAVEVSRSMIGSTDSSTAQPGTIRGDFSLSKSENLVHGSDSLDSAAREFALWFPEGVLD